MDQVGDWVGTRSPLWESCSKPNYSILTPCHMTSDWVIIDYPINFANEINILLDNFVYSEYDGMHYVITQFPPYSQTRVQEHYPEAYSALTIKYEIH